MARENEGEERNCPGRTGPGSGIDSGEEPNDIDVACPHCGSLLTRGGRLLTSGRADPTCPDCGTSFSVRVREEFALVERGGWTVAVSLGPADPQEAVDG